MSYIRQYNYTLIIFCFNYTPAPVLFNSALFDKAPIRSPFDRNPLRNPLLGVWALVLTPLHLGFPGLKSIAAALLFCSGEGDVEFPAYGLRKIPISSGQVILPESCSLL